MGSYEEFAWVYDEFMDNVPYEKWCDQICSVLKREGIESGIVADLGCGTGELTELLAKQGYDMIGIDNAQEMLNVAMEKRYVSGLDILYLLQDMRSFELYGSCRAIISRCDSINYITSYEDLVQVFRLVNNYLDPKGLFIFDCNSPYKYREVLGETTIAENRENGSFIWENSYDEQSHINEYDLTLYIQNEDGQQYRRYEETHLQRAYTIGEIKQAAKEAGLVFQFLVDADTDNEVTRHTERYLFCMQENGK